MVSQEANPSKQNKKTTERDQARTRSINSPVNILDSATYLVRKVLSLVINEGMPRPQELAHIGIHKLCDNINVIKRVVIVRLIDIQDAQNVFMSHRAHETNLTDDTLRVGKVFEDGGDFFDSDPCLSKGVVGGADNAVSAQTEGFVERVAGVEAKGGAFDVEGSFGGG